MCVSTIVAASITYLRCSFQTTNEEPFIKMRSSYTLRWFACCSDLDEDAELCVEVVQAQAQQLYLYYNMPASYIQGLGGDY